VKRVIGTLRQMNRLRDTYILFTSDNGFFFGEHRLAGGKFLAYEPSTHLPFLIRGPGIKPRSASGELTANVDIAPTVLELAGVKADESIDGRSMVPFLHNPRRRSRRPILFESFVQTYDGEETGGGPPATAASAAAGSSGGGPSVNARPRRGAGASIAAPPKDYAGIRLGPWKYIEWPDGEKELYNIDRDPNELNNRARRPNLFPIRNFLHTQLLRLESCVGWRCRRQAPPIPPTRRQRQRRLRHHSQHR
jgi:N-acetylglucosamine-6-sulfatase